MNLRLVFLLRLLGCVSPEEEIEQSFLLPAECTDGTCDTHGTCTPGSTMCTCGSDYTARTDQCVSRTVPTEKLRLLNDDAYDQTSGECLPREINYNDACGAFSAECDGTISDKKCKCLPGTFYFLEECVTSAFPTKTCSVAGKNCSFNNGICSFNKSCICKPGYHVEYDRCVSKTFRPEGGCPPYTPCGEEGHCSGDNVTCVCSHDYVAHGTQCLRITFQFHPSCSKADVCAFGDGNCARGPNQDHNKCICKPGYYKEGDKCVTPYFKATPTDCRAIGAECDSGKGVCFDFEVCKCNDGYFAMRRHCVKGSFASATCRSKELCDDGRGKCKPSMCQCSKQSWAENGTCVFPSFTHTGCKDGAACSLGKGVCDGDSRCLCISRYLVYPRYATHECRSLSIQAVSALSSLDSLSFCLATLVTIACASTLFWY
ncbi:hypothetical protein BaRGS_00017187 [Batillaria attramentaria]|uniref:EGF-like domain-containing protein n=1 Tax=Batillaria attramentaria TaxID=370345 RepID=A0ABD0KWJ4_9CAEN